MLGVDVARTIDSEREACADLITLERSFTSLVLISEFIFLLKMDLGPIGFKDSFARPHQVTAGEAEVTRTGQYLR